jgi:hypothetical protein
MSHQTFCKGMNKNGLPCGAHAMPAGYCFFHSDPNRAAELGRAGGRRNRHVIENPLPPLPAVKTVNDVRAALIQVTEEMRARQLDAGIGKVIIFALNLTLRTLADTELKEEFEELRKQQAQVLAGKKSA